MYRRPPFPIDDPWLTPDEVAAYLSRTPDALAMLRYRGTGPAYSKVASRVRYRLSAVDAWLASGERDRT